jgi:hypothetical protein
LWEQEASVEITAAHPMFKMMFTLRLGGVTAAHFLQYPMVRQNIF